MGNLFTSRLALEVAVLALALHVFAALVRWEPHTQDWLWVHTPEWVPEQRIAKGLRKLELSQKKEPKRQ